VSDDLRALVAKQMRQLMEVFGPEADMRALVMGPEFKAAMKRLADNAEANRLDEKAILEMAYGNATPPGDRAGFVETVAVGYRVVYSIEKHFDKWLRHASISVDSPGKLPNVAAVEAIAKELGFPELHWCDLKIEDWPGGKAMNVFARME
jgi:hypothetical protein